MSQIKIACLPGDGVGPEVYHSVKALLQAVNHKFSRAIELTEYLIGGAAIDACGQPLPAETLQACKNADAVFLGAVGGPRWDDPSLAVRPEQGLLQLRKSLEVYANIRPLTAYSSLLDASPLKQNIIENVDFVIVRELTGGLYFGRKTRTSDYATDECRYSVDEIQRIAHVACETAMQRKRVLTSVDKANVLETSRLWREVVSAYVEQNFPEIKLNHQLVDSCAMKLISSPREFDVILTENMFGDILSDEASVLSGSMGLLASASIGERHALFEPIHGSAPDIAGQGVVNPIAAILSAAMMLRWLKLFDEADSIEKAVRATIDARILTPDLNSNQRYLTQDVTRAVIERL